MALSSLPPFMQLLLNRRFSRIFLLICPLLLFLLAAALWSSPGLRDNGVGRGMLPWFGSGKSTDPEFYPFETTSQFFPVSQDIEGKTTKELCDSFPSYITHRIQPVLKMGYGEKRNKIEAQLDSVSACFSDEELLIFSDLNETVRDRNVIDILADLPASYAVDNPHFQNYVSMQELRRNGTLNADTIAAAGINGWDLDKFKFLPMVERAWAMRPGRDWYVFYETDTYIVWDNMFRFLSTLDPSTPQYIGSPSPGRHDTTRRKPLKTWFANGGPGFVLSRAAIERLLFRKAGPTTGQYLDPPLGVKWLDLLRRDCCGDSVMGWTLWNVSVPLGGYWPMFNPHPLHGVPYSDLYWCQPVITLHKTRPEDMLDLWRWEHGRRQKEVSGQASPSVSDNCRFCGSGKHSVAQISPRHGSPGMLTHILSLPRPLYYTKTSTSSATPARQPCGTTGTTANGHASRLRASTRPKRAPRRARPTASASNGSGAASTSRSAFSCARSVSVCRGSPRSSLNRSQTQRRRARGSKGGRRRKMRPSRKRGGLTLRAGG